MARKVSQLEKRFGKRGKKGDDGEKWLIKKLRESKQYDEVKDFSKEWKMQELGIDGSVKKKSWHRPYYYDCKHNLVKKNKTTYKIYLEWTKPYSCKTGWFHTSGANRIYHVSVKHNTSIFYDLRQMRQRIREQINLGHIEVVHKSRKESCVLIEHNDPAFQDLLRFQY